MAVSKKDTPVSAMRERADGAPDTAPEVEPDDTAPVEPDAAGPAGAADAYPARRDDAHLGSGDQPLPELVIGDPRMERVDVELPTTAAPEVEAPTTPVVPPFMSEGVRQDLQHSLRVLDPMTGGTFVRDPDTNKVTFHAKTGEVVEL